MLRAAYRCVSRHSIATLNVLVSSFASLFFRSYELQFNCGQQKLNVTQHPQSRSRQSRDIEFEEHNVFALRNHIAFYGKTRTTAGALLVFIRMCDTGDRLKYAIQSQSNNNLHKHNEWNAFNKTAKCRIYLEAYHVYQITFCSVRFFANEKVILCNNNFNFRGAASFKHFLQLCIYRFRTYRKFAWYNWCFTINNICNFLYVG